MLSPLQSPSISPSSSPTTSITPEALPVTFSNPSTSPNPPSCSDSQVKPRRNYIQRKKCLNNSVNQIVNVLNFIQVLQKDSVSPIEKQKVAYAHAQKIEAACWSPHSKLTPESYEKLISAKTAELCRVILKKSIPQMDSNKIQQLKQLIFSKNPTALTLNVSQLESNNVINTNSNNKSSKVKNGQGQIPNPTFEQTLLPEFPNTKNVSRTGPLTIDASNNVSLTIFDSSPTNLLSSDTFSNTMLNNTCSAPVFPEINNNRISIAPLKEMVPNLSTYLSIEKLDQTPSLNVLSEFEPMDQKSSFDDANQDFSIDPLLISQAGQSGDIFQSWTQKEQDLFGSCVL